MLVTGPRRSPRSGDGAGEEGAGPGPSARRSVSQDTSASGWSAWSTEDSEGESSAHKRRRFELLRREHYDMRQALAKCVARHMKKRMREKVSGGLRAAQRRKHSLE